jgi:hypothetical protein
MTEWIRSMLPDDNNKAVHVAGAAAAPIASTAAASETKEAKAFVTIATGTAFTRVLVFNDAVSALASGTLGMSSSFPTLT